MARGVGEAAPAYVAHYRLAGCHAERAEQVIARHTGTACDLGERDVACEVRFDEPQRLAHHPVIPAQAGTQGNSTHVAALGSRFRGNDGVVDWFAHGCTVPVLLPARLIAVAVSRPRRNGCRARSPPTRPRAATQIACGAGTLRGTPDRTSRPLPCFPPWRRAPGRVNAATRRHHPPMGAG